MKADRRKPKHELVLDGFRPGIHYEPPKARTYDASDFVFDEVVKPRSHEPEGDVVFKSIDDPSTKKWKMVQHRRAVRAEGVQSRRQTGRVHKSVQDLAQTVLKLEEDDFDPVEKVIYVEPRPPSVGDASHGVVAEPKGGALVVRSGGCG